MTTIHKNPVVYYVGLPVLIALWPLLVFEVYLPNVEKKLVKERDEYKKAQKIMEEILILDPDRLNSSASSADGVKFDYAIAVENIASSCRISSADYNVSSKPARTSSGQKTQSAMVVLKKVDITQFARFLSTIQLRWANLQCENVTLTKQKGIADLWKVNLEFKYFY